MCQIRKRSTFSFKLDVMLPTLVSGRTSSGVASGMARIFSRCASPILQPFAEIGGTHYRTFSGQAENSRRFFTATGPQTGLRVTGRLNSYNGDMGYLALSSVRHPFVPQ